MTHGQVADTLDKGMAHVPGGMGQDGARFHHSTQNSAKFKTSEFFVSGISPLIFLDRGWPQVTETVGSEATRRGDCSTTLVNVSHGAKLKCV